MAKSPKTTGGPAFPTIDLVEGTTIDAKSGMTLRDYFAGQALTSFQRNHEVEQYHGDAGNTSIIAEKCYAIADAMIRERTK